MSLIGQILYRIIFILGIAWIAMGMVVFVALVWDTFRRMRQPRMVWVTTECPNCDGTGWDEDDACTLCDGQSALTMQVPDPKVLTK